MGAPKALTIAGSDSGGGAGIQADLKTFSAFRTFGMSVLTAVTAQNSVGVTGVHNLPPEFVALQLDAVLGDFGADAIKIGMLSTAPIVEAVAERLRDRAEAPIVLDPVMIAKSGAPLLQPDARKALIERMLPLAEVVTPNLPEARELAGLGEGASAEELARAIQALGPEAVVVTGGHSDDGADVLFDGIGTLRIDGPRYADGTSHGSGCTHSSALAAFLARNAEVAEAARWAREIASEAVGNGLAGIGSGAGPVDATGIIRR